MKRKKFQNTEKSFSVDGFDDEVLTKAEGQQKYISYDKGELRIEIPKDS